MTWARVAARQEKDLWCSLVWISQELNGLARGATMARRTARIEWMQSEAEDLSAQGAKGETGEVRSITGRLPGQKKKKKSRDKGAASWPCKTALRQSGALSQQAPQSGPYRSSTSVRA